MDTLKMMILSLPNSASIVQVQVSRYAASRQDAVIYRESTLKSASVLVTAAVLTPLSEEGGSGEEEGGGGEEKDEEEDEDSGEDSESEATTARGSAFEFKLTATYSNLGQLVANMFKLSADLTYQAATHGNLISDVHIFGLLVDISKELCFPILLKFSLMSESHFLLIPRMVQHNWLDFNEALHRLSHIL